MRTLFLALPLLATLALPLQAQGGGSANRRSPKVTQAIAFTNECSVEITYKSLTWAQGRWTEMVKQERGRERLNADSQANPLGSLKASKAFTLGGKAVAAGDYKLYFKADDNADWHLVLEPEKGDALTWKLDLADSKNRHTRLSIVILAGESDDAANVNIHFGTMACSVAMVARAEESDKKPAEAASIR